jgi:hypothetical protein
MLQRARLHLLKAFLTQGSPTATNVYGYSSYNNLVGRMGREALCAAGYVTLDKQADALGLGRSTAWTVLRADHKASGLTGAVLERMLAAPKLPDIDHEKLLEYIAKKSAGLYGHCASQRRRFLAALSVRCVRAEALTDV